MTVTQEEIAAAFDNLATTTAHAQTVHLACINAQADLEEKIAMARYNGNLEGKNEKDREASAMLMFPKEHEAVSLAHMAHHKAKLEMDVAKINADKVRYLLRFMEYSK